MAGPVPSPQVSAQASAVRLGPVAILRFTTRRTARSPSMGAAQLLEQLTMLLADETVRAVVV